MPQGDSLVEEEEAVIEASTGHRGGLLQAFHSGATPMTELIEAGTEIRCKVNNNLQIIFLLRSLKVVRFWSH